MPVAIEPVTQVFHESWPSAQITHLLDDSLPADLTAAGGITPGIIDRFVTLARYSEDCGADAILFTCSAFGSAIEAAKQAVRVPVLKPNEAMFDEALAVGTDVALIVTFEPSIPSQEGIGGAWASAAEFGFSSRPRPCPPRSRRSSRAAPRSTTS